MDHKNDVTEWDTQAIKAILAQFHELTSVDRGDLSAEQLNQNNEAFLRLLDHLNALITLGKREEN